MITLEKAKINIEFGVESFEITGIIGKRNLFEKSS